NVLCPFRLDPFDLVYFFCFVVSQFRCAASQAVPMIAVRCVIAYAQCRHQISCVLLCHIPLPFLSHCNVFETSFYYEPIVQLDGVTQLIAINPYFILSP
ncbi:hypothetical protein PHET_07722, partial [Paragonimus heterotremus]